MVNRAVGGLLLVLYSTLLLMSYTGTPTGSSLPSGRARSFSKVALGLCSGATVLQRRGNRGVVTNNFFSCTSLSSVTNFRISMGPCSRGVRLAGVLTNSGSVSVCLISVERTRVLIRLNTYRPVGSSGMGSFGSGYFSSLREVYIGSDNRAILVPISFTVSNLFIPGSTISRLKVASRSMECLCSCLSCVGTCGNRQVDCLAPPARLFGQVRRRCTYCCYGCSRNRFSFAASAFGGLCAALLKS